MSLSTCPTVVLDNVLNQLDVPELLALSLVCKSIHYHANRFLYRKAYNPYLYSTTWEDWYDSSPHVSSPTRLEICLLRNPENGKYLRTHMSTSPWHLKELWTQVPLRLSCLEIPFAYKWFQDQDNEEFQKLILEKHPETSIEEITVNFQDGYNEQVVYLLPSQLCHFRNLKTLSIAFRDEDSNPSIRNILDSINCPHLERVTLEGIKILPCDDWPGGNLPNLKVLDVQPSFNILDDDHDDFLQVAGDIWALFRRLRAKNVDFRYGYPGQPTLIDFICLSGHRDSDSILQWLVQCEFRIQVYPHQYSLEYSLRLDLTECNPRSRDRVLVTLSMLEATRSLTLWIELCDDDTLSTVGLLPKNISYLSIYVRGTVPLTLVPDVVRWSNGLSYLYISRFPNGWSLQRSCFADGLRFPSHIVIGGDVRTKVKVKSFRFSLSKGWTAREYCKPDKVIDVATNLDLGEMEAELRWLCSLNPTLNEVSLYIDD